MDFERNKDPKKCIGLGPENIAIEIDGLAMNIFANFRSSCGPFPAHKILSDSNNIRVLLGIEAKELQIEQYSIPNSRGEFINGKRKKYIALKKFRGKWLKYRSHIYYIPHE